MASAEPLEVTLSGVRVRLLQRSATLALVELRVAPGVVAPPHRHRDTDELIIASSHGLEVSVEDDQRHLEPGEIAVATDGAAHGFRNHADDEAWATAVFAPPSFVEYFREAAAAIGDSEALRAVARRWGVEPA